MVTYATSPLMAAGFAGVRFAPTGRHLLESDHVAAPTEQNAGDDYGGGILFARVALRPLALSLGRIRHNFYCGGSAQNGIASDLYLVEVRRLRGAATGPARFDA